MLSRIERSTNVARLRGSLLAEAPASSVARGLSISPGESVPASLMVSKMDLRRALECEIECEGKAEALGAVVAHDAAEGLAACATSVEKRSSVLD